MMQEALLQKSRNLQAKTIQHSSLWVSLKKDKFFYGTS